MGQLHMCDITGSWRRAILSFRGGGGARGGNQEDHQQLLNMIEGDMGNNRSIGTASRIAHNMADPFTKQALEVVSYIEGTGVGHARMQSNVV